LSVGRRRGGQTGRRERQDPDDVLPSATSHGHHKGHQMGVTGRFVPGHRAGQAGKRELKDPDFFNEIIKEKG
jgi:hypothetical protein